MSKRPLSPAPFLPAKRLHTLEPKSTVDRATFSFNDTLYDELVLNIFSNLSWADLCAAQATSTHWCRLASDNTLWKNLYLRIFGRTRLRGSRGYLARSDGLEVRPLPGRSIWKQGPLMDWKWMFKVSSNWRNGRCAIEELIDNRAAVRAQESDPTNTSQTPCDPHILLAGPLTVVAPSQPSEHLTLNLSTCTSNHFRMPCDSRIGGGSHRITALAVDQSQPVQGHLRLAVFISSAEFTIFSVNPAQLSSSVRKLTYLPSGGRSRGPPVTHAVYHHPLLVTLSQNFTLSLYNLAGDTVVLTQTLTSFTSYFPSSIVLSMTSTTTYKLVLTYTVPVYPAHWSVGATEVIISGPRSSSILPDRDQLLTNPMCVVSTRTIRALDVPPGFFDDEKLRSLRDQYSRKVLCVTDAQTDGKWVVLAPAETTPPSTTSISYTTMPPSLSTPNTSFLNSSTTLQLYRLFLPNPSKSVAAQAPKLTFVRNLHGQTGPIASLALADGRCVSLGLNGSLWVWDLETGTGAEVSCQESEPLSDLSLASVVAFDDRRIVTTRGYHVFVHRFDI